MNSDMMNSDIMSQAAGVPDVLVKKLSDEALQEYFQNLSPKQVRNILK
jgi:uncharacterized protein YdeI (YjbR/CyaY-like superfamily)